MTRQQAHQLGNALVAWSRGSNLEARDALAKMKAWMPFCPSSYEHLNVTEGTEWRLARDFVARKDDQG